MTPHLIPCTYKPPEARRPVSYGRLVTIGKKQIELSDERPPRGLFEPHGEVLIDPTGRSAGAG